MNRNQADLIFGVNPVSEKLRASPQEILELILIKGNLRPALQKIEAEARMRGVTVAYASPAFFAEHAGGHVHQGVIARALPFSYAAFSDVLASSGSIAGVGRILLLDSITDARNFGALLRVAEGSGIRHVVIPKDRSAEVTPVVTKASAGAVHYLKIARVTNLHRAIKALQEHGYWVVGLDDQAAETIYERIYPQRLGIVLGSEGRGIRPLVLKSCDYRVSIPMLGTLSSLNVSTAGAVFLYELVRRDRSIDNRGLAR